MSAPNSKYEKLYREDPAVCGDPFSEFVKFAMELDGKGRSVLDLGCGQGRDAFVFARRGFKVVGVDSSPAGISQMSDRASNEGLNIEGAVADIRDYMPSQNFDVIVIDRTLHMLPTASERIAVLERCVPFLNIGGHILIADERSNIPDITAFFEREDGQWEFKDGLKPAFIFATLVKREGLI